MAEPENVIFVIINKSTKEKVKVLQHIIYMDESGKDGKFYGNFYGGALIRSTDLLQTIEELSFLKQSLNLYGEVKWQKVTSQYLDKYMQLTGLFFDFIERDVIKIRIMFTHNYRQPINLTRTQMDNTFTQLYYQFFKHAFGLQYSNPDPKTEVSLRLYFDELPINPSQKQEFKKFIVDLGRNADFSKANLLIRPEDIAEVKSHEHIILQCMDIILGAMYFRLNDLHNPTFDFPVAIYPYDRRFLGKNTSSTRMTPFNFAVVVT